MQPSQVAAAMSTVEMDSCSIAERPTVKPKLSFFQRLNERHETLLSSMRLKVGDVGTHPADRQQESSGTFSPTFKAFSKTFLLPSNIALDRSRHEYALRYDDIENGVQPSASNSQPTSTTRTYGDMAIPYRRDVGRKHVKQPKQKEQNLFWRPNTWHRYSSMDPSSLLPTSPTARRPGTSPSEMSDEELDEWLEKPEDAEMHRGRKTSTTTTSSEVAFGQQEWNQNQANKEGNDIELVVSKKRDWPLDPYSQSWLVGAEEEEEAIEGLEEFQLNAEIETMQTQAVYTTGPDHKATFSAMPDEIILEIARHLDMRSVAILRLGCTKLFHSIPAPLRPLALKKT